MISKGRFIVLYLLLAVSTAYVNLHADVVVPLNRPFSEFPAAVGDWRMVSQSEMSPDVLGTLKPTDYLSRVYEDDGGTIVKLYIGYHSGGKGVGEIHSPKHCLPGSGWYMVSTKRIQLGSGGDRLDLVRAVYQKGDIRELFYYWFQVRGRTISDEYSLKLAEVGNSVMRHRRDAAFIRISVPVEMDEELSSDTGMEFIRDFFPAITEFLPS